MQESTPSERQFQTMLVLYQRLDDDIHEWQRRQWHVVYCALLLLGGMVGLYMKRDAFPNAEPDLCVIHWLVWLVVLLGAVFICLLQCASRSARSGIKEIQSEPVYSGAFTHLPRVGDTYGEWWRHWSPVSIFFAVEVGAAAIVDFFLSGEVYMVTWAAILLVVLVLVLTFTLDEIVAPILDKKARAKSN